MGGPGSGRSRRPITRNRPKKRWKCHWKPVRSIPRTVNARDAGRFACAAMRNGWPLQQIEAEIIRQCAEKEFIENPTPVGTEAVSLLAREIEFNTEVLNKAVIAMGILSSVLLGVVFLGRAIPNPLVRAASLPAQAARTQVQNLLRDLEAQRLRNNDIIAKVVAGRFEARLRELVPLD